MKYYKYWVKESFRIKVGEGVEEINILCGSMQSKSHASEEAKIKADAIEQKISDGESADSYEAAIKEHVSEFIDDENIVTVCRYGARVLNSTQYTILDLDDYPVDFFDMFKALRKLPKKERIVAKFLQRLKRNPVLGSNFRIYETSKGIRVIGQQYLDPADRKHSRLMRKLGVDWIYIQLSRKQKCYRARLTPKPHRLKIQTIKIKSPLDCESQGYIDWDTEYREQSKNVSVVKLIKTIGSDFSRDRVIRLHDETCQAGLSKQLV